MARKQAPEKFEAKRRELLEVAMMCFAEKGFHSTPTTDICRAAGMSPGNLFHYFPTKEAIIQGIAERDREDLARLFASVAPSEDALSDIMRLLDLLLNQVREPYYARLAIEIFAEATRNSAVAEMFADNDVECRQALVMLLANGVARGQIDDALDISKAAFWLLTLVDGVVGRAAVDPSYDPAEDRDTLVKLVRGFLAPPG
jgi:TetR/AcrR family transcriptional regulator, repressor for uid operon